MSGYDQIKALSKEYGMPIKELIVLARQNDPYFSGSPTQVREAEWFAEHWNAWSAPHKHIRDFHYHLQSSGDIAMTRPLDIKDPVTKAFMYTTEVYINKKECWEYLNPLAKHARYQGLIDPREFTDMRNPKMVHHANHDFDPAPYYELFARTWDLPRPSDLSFYGLRLSTPDVEGYDYDHGAQKYLLALFVEKSTMAEEFTRLCGRYGMTYMQGIGFTSITRLLNLLDVSRKTGKPVRIFYISDYDLAGKAMPVAAARQIQYWTDKSGGGVDIKLNPICLTAEQVELYDLPKSPDKEDVELNALGTLHPGEMEKIVQHAVQPYFDDGLYRKCREAGGEAQESVDEQWEDFSDKAQATADDLERRIEAVYKKYAPDLNELTERMNEELEPLEEEKAELESEIEDLVATFDPDLPERPEPDPEEQDEDDWLYDSERSYFEQTDHFNDAKEAA